MEYSSSSVQYQPFQLYLLREEFQFDKLHQKDGEEGAGTEGRNNCGKIKTNSFASVVPASCTSAKNLVASIGPGILIASGKLVSRMRGDSESDAASSSRARLKQCIPWRGDGHSLGKNSRYKRGIRGCGSFRI